ncbi:MAG: dihydrodipicolinate synthase family protein [Filimonas sp.]|nr:dihydrodipicolinate synthase family protein [Filimonas sp.]
MKSLTSSQIYGNWATLLLPINPNDSIDYKALSDEIDILIAYKVNGIYSNGTAGEFYNQTEQEFDHVSQLLAEKCNAANMPFQVGCNHTSPIVSLERVRRIKQLEPGAMQIILPDWFPPTMPEIIDYLQRIQDAAGDIGLVLYNPPHAKVKLQPEDFCEIMKHVKLVGCKVAGGDQQWYEDMQPLFSQLSVFIPGHHLATGYQYGAHGAYSNVACLHPLAAQRWYDLMQCDMEKALELQSRIQQFMHACIVPYIVQQGYANQAVDKFMAAVGGWATVSPRLRWPYKSIGEENIEGVRHKAREILPEFFGKNMLAENTEYAEK